jgi:hypothetical protein
MRNRSVAVSLLASLCLSLDALGQGATEGATEVVNPDAGSTAMGTVSVPAEAVTKLTNGAPGANGSLGITFVGRSMYVRAKIAIAPSPVETTNGSQQDYRTLLLQPDVQGASVAADGAWSRVIESAVPLLFHAGASIKVSPQLIWKFEDRVLDANMMPVLDSDGKPRLTTTRQDFSAAAFSAFFRLTLNLNGAVGNKSAEAQIALEIPITLRTLFGTGIQDVAFVERALGTKSTLFFGSEPKLLVGLGNISVFAAFPVLVSIGGAAAPGLTGFNVYFGAAVRGDVLSWDLGAATQKQPIPAI